MKVLYLLGNYPKVSETYVAAEIAFMLRQGVRVEVYAPGGGCPGGVAAVPVHRGRIEDALIHFGPDLVHVHYLVVHHEAIAKAGLAGLPVTVRGHSFDFSEPNVLALAEKSWVRRFYLFPHFAAHFPGHAKVQAMPVAFEPRMFFPEQKEKRLVFRTGAAKPDKGLKDFMAVALRSPRHRFLLAVDTVQASYMQTLRREASGRVELQEAVQNTEAARLTRTAGIYLSTNDPSGHPFGMPISVAESMASGSLVLMRDGGAARAYAEEGAVYYRSPDEAASLVNATLEWDDAQWASVKEKAVARAKAFSADAVLPRMLEDWKKLTGTK